MAAICSASRNSPTFTLHFMLGSFGWAGPSRPAPDYAAFPFTGFAGVFGAAPTRLPAAPSLASRRLHWHLKQSFLPSYLSFEFSMILVTVNGFSTPSPLTSISTPVIDRKSTRLNSSHLVISYAVF